MTDQLEPEREIRSMNLCVAAFLTAIDQLFAPMAGEWKPITTTSSGVDITITGQNERGIFVNIRPVSWRDDCRIDLRIQELNSGWQVVAGTVGAYHINDPTTDSERGLRFVFNYSGIPHLPPQPDRFEPSDTISRELFEYLRE